MLKKILFLLVCFVFTSYFSVSNAHGTFTWFGLRKDNTEITFQRSDDVGHKPHWHHKHKPKPKPKHKKHHPKKKFHFHKWWEKY